MNKRAIWYVTLSVIVGSLAWFWMACTATMQGTATVSGIVVDAEGPVAGAIVLTARSIFFTPLYNARILNMPWWTFLPSLIAGVVGCLAVGAGTYWISSTWTLTGWGQLALVAVITSGIYIIAAYFLGLDADDRDFVKSEVRRRRERTIGIGGD